MTDEDLQQELIAFAHGRGGPQPPESEAPC